MKEKKGGKKSPKKVTGHSPTKAHVQKPLPRHGESKQKKKKVKIKYKNILLFLLFLVIVVLFNWWLFNLPIRNIIIRGNTFLTDQQIIEMAGLSDYPASLQNSDRSIEKRLTKETFIKSATVTKKGIREVIITVVENRPLLFNSNTNKTVLLDHSEVEDTFPVPYLINYVPDNIYDTFIDALAKITPDILLRISEIQYKPNDVDTERFFLAMNDGNYVYLTLPKFDSINSYIEIVKNFNDKKGILYLDSGEYFQILEN